MSRFTSRRLLILVALAAFLAAGLWIARSYSRRYAPALAPTEQTAPVVSPLPEGAATPPSQSNDRPAVTGMLRLASIVIVIAMVAGATWYIPRWQTQHWAARGEIAPKDLADLEDKYRKTVVQFIAGASILAAIYAVDQSTRSANANLQVATANLQLARDRLELDRQATLRRMDVEQFSRAVDQLGRKGKDELEVRLGGLYTLDRLARASSDYRAAALDVVSTYLRVGSSIDKKNRAAPGGTELQVALTILCKRDAAENVGRLDLEGAVLGGLTCVEGNLTNLILRSASLSGSDLSSANLTGADLTGADLDGADLSDADLTDTILEEASLSCANLAGANLTNASLSGWTQFSTHYGSAPAAEAVEEKVGDHLRQACIYDDTTLPSYADHLFEGHNLGGHLVWQPERCSCPERNPEP